MNKIITLLTVIVLFAVSGCKSFKQYFNPPVKKQHHALAPKRALTPQEQRKKAMREKMYKPQKDNAPLKTNLGSSLNSYEKSYLNDYYKKHNPKKENSKHNIFKFF